MCSLWYLWSYKSLDMQRLICGLKADSDIFFSLFEWSSHMGLKRCGSWKLQLEWRMTPWWQHYDTLPAGFDRVPPRRVTMLSCVSNPSQHAAHTQGATHNSHTPYIPSRPSLTRHSSMPRRPIRHRLMRRSVTHLRMHDKVLLDFPVATVCSLLTLLNMHECTHMCSHPHHAFTCDRGCMSRAITSAVRDMMRGPFTAVKDSFKREYLSFTCQIKRLQAKAVTSGQNF